MKQVVTAGAGTPTHDGAAAPQRFVARLARKSAGAVRKPPAPGGAMHRSLERGLSVIEVLALSGGNVSLADLSRRLGLHRSTAHHLLRSLVALGWLRQCAKTRCYQLTTKLFSLTGTRWSVEQLGPLAQPHLESLAQVTGEATRLSAWVNGKLTIAALHDPAGTAIPGLDVGTTRQIHCCAMGKVLAAWMPAPELRAVLTRTGMPALTPRTITSRTEFYAELKRVREAGYAVNDEEQSPGLRAVAVPVFCQTGDVIGALCVGGPRERLTSQRMRALREPLVAHAEQISQLLGWLPGTA